MKWLKTQAILCLFALCWMGMRLIERFYSEDDYDHAKET